MFGGGAEHGTQGSQSLQDLLARILAGCLRPPWEVGHPHALCVEFSRRALFLGESGVKSVI